MCLYLYRVEDLCGVVAGGEASVQGRKVLTFGSRCNSAGHTLTTSTCHSASFIEGAHNNVHTNTSALRSNQTLHSSTTSLYM